MIRVLTALLLSMAPAVVAGAQETQACKYDGNQYIPSASAEEIAAKYVDGDIAEFSALACNEGETATIAYVVLIPSDLVSVKPDVSVVRVDFQDEGNPQKDVFPTDYRDIPQDRQSSVWADWVKQYVQKMNFCPVFPFC